MKDRKYFIRSGFYMQVQVKTAGVLFFPLNTDICQKLYTLSKLSRLPAVSCIRRYSSAHPKLSLPA